MVNSGSIPDIFLILVNMEIIEYILGDVGHLLGFIAILYIVFEGISSIIRAFKE